MSLNTLGSWTRTTDNDDHVYIGEEHNEGRHQ